MYTKNVNKYIGYKRKIMKNNNNRYKVILRNKFVFVRINYIKLDIIICF